MAEVIGVRFKSVGKIYYFDPQGMQLVKAQKVIVETANGVECGEVAMPNREVEDSAVVQPLRSVLRRASTEDLEQLEQNREKERKAFQTCSEKIAKHKLDMKLVDVEYAFDRNKILFYFTADGRVDFRDLVKDLAAVFRTRIELRQIGVRDEAKMLGGLGVCGRPFCCATFLGEFQPVSIKMAKEQGLSLNPTKISGACGRLMCCLKYEQAAYEDLYRHTPKVGATVSTPEGKGTVCEVSLLTGLLKVRLEKDPAASPMVFPKEEVKTVRDGRPWTDTGEKVIPPEVKEAFSEETGESAEKPSKQERPKRERGPYRPRNRQRADTDKKEKGSKPPQQ